MVNSLVDKPVKIAGNANNKKIPKVIPIIQTRGMKAKIADRADQINKQQELEYFNGIDTMTSVEIVGGENTDNLSNIDHDGVELSVQGSDIEDFPDKAEPGEVSEDEEEVVCRPKIASKVVKVKNRSRFESHDRSDSDILKLQPPQW